MKTQVTNSSLFLVKGFEILALQLALCFKFSHGHFITWPFLSMMKAQPYETTSTTSNELFPVVLYQMGDLGLGRRAVAAGGGGAIIHVVKEEVLVQIGLGSAAT